MIYFDGGQTTRAETAGLTPAEVRALTRPAAPPLCPEILLPSLPDSKDFDAFRSDHAGLVGAAVPYWALAWPGGQGLARYLLDRPESVRGQAVVDLGAGAGLVAAAALRAGASAALALDCDPNALAAVAETGRLNGVTIEARLGALESFEPPAGSLVCAGDLWYERPLARRATAALRRLAAAGHRVLCGDPGRPSAPRKGLVERARYRVEASEAFERARRVECRVFELGP